MMTTAGDAEDASSDWRCKSCTDTIIMMIAADVREA